MIEILQGVDLQRYSKYQGVASEAEVLLYPGTRLKVIGSMEMDGGLFQVHLREVPLREVPLASAFFFGRQDEVNPIQ